MIKGTDITLAISNSSGVKSMAGCTNVAVELSTEVKEVSALPGSADDDGWAHYDAGRIGWGLSADGYMASDSGWMMNSDDYYTATVSIVDGSTTKRLIGYVQVSEASCQADRRALLNYTVKFACDNFPMIR